MEIIRHEGLVIAVEGCMHGALEKVYNRVRQLEEQLDEKVDVLVNCGDFQSIRDSNDLKYMKVPNKYKQMGDFHLYYSGQKQVPYLTIFIGGNHEASNYLKQLPMGGWVCDNIYYLGTTGVLTLNKNNRQYTIGGISGIYNQHSFNTPRNTEQLPLNIHQLSTAFHYRQVDILKLALFQSTIQIFISHDWPNLVHQHGHLPSLLQYKPHFQQDIHKQSLGSPPLHFLLDNLMPVHWFSAHLHCHYTANYNFNNKVTQFMALDKCLPNRHYVHIHRVTPLSTLSSNQSIHPTVTLHQHPQWLNICRQFELYFIHHQSFPQYILRVNHHNQVILDHTLLNNLLQYFQTIPLVQFTEQQLAIPNQFKDIQNGIFNYQTDNFLDLIGIKKQDFYKQFNLFYKQIDQNNQEKGFQKEKKEQNELFDEKKYQDENEIELDLDE